MLPLHAIDMLNYGLGFLIYISLKSCIFVAFTCRIRRVQLLQYLNKYSVMSHGINRHAIADSRDLRNLVGYIRVRC